MMILILYSLVCLMWTILRYITNKKDNKPVLKIIGYVLFDFFLYPISYFYHTYTEILKIHKNGKKG